MPHEAAVGPPQHGQPTPTSTRAAAGVQIRGEPEPTDQKGQSCREACWPTQQQGESQPQQPADGPGGSIVTAAASQDAGLKLNSGSLRQPLGTMGRPPG